MRGTHGGTQQICDGRGIIPALAGNTYDVGARMIRARDHPRACGEHARALLGDQFDQGSSPRLRGTLGANRFEVLHHGIIPALAGNTSARVVKCLNWRDHPRACGEHEISVETPQAFAGSSPRLRGTRGRRRRLPAGHGIIPALAGNTGIFHRKLWCTRDHPRACGERLSTVL